MNTERQLIKDLSEGMTRLYERIDEGKRDTAGRNALQASYKYLESPSTESSDREAGEPTPEGVGKALDVLLNSPQNPITYPFEPLITIEGRQYREMPPFSIIQAGDVWEEHGHGYVEVPQSAFGGQVYERILLRPVEVMAEDKGMEQTEYVLRETIKLLEQSISELEKDLERGKRFEDKLATEGEGLRDEVTDLTKRVIQLTEERDILARWKEEQLTVTSWWQNIDDFIRKHPNALVGMDVSAIALKWLVERDTLRVAMGIGDNQHIVAQTPKHGSILIREGSTRRRISPIDDEIIALDRQVNQLTEDQQERAACIQRQRDENADLKNRILQLETDYAKQVGLAEQYYATIVKQRDEIAQLIDEAKIHAVDLGLAHDEYAELRKQISSTPHWIPVSERMPRREDAHNCNGALLVLWGNQYGAWTAMWNDQITWIGLQYAGKPPSHWLSIPTVPPLPTPLDPAEEAWREYSKGLPALERDEVAYKAGFNFNAAARKAQA